MQLLFASALLPKLCTLQPELLAPPAPITSAIVRLYHAVCALGPGISVSPSDVVQSLKQSRTLAGYVCASESNLQRRGAAQPLDQSAGEFLRQLLEVMSEEHHDIAHCIEQCFSTQLIMNVRRTCPNWATGTCESAMTDAEGFLAINEETPSCFVQLTYIPGSPDSVADLLAREARVEESVESYFECPGCDRKVEGECLRRVSTNFISDGEELLIEITRDSTAAALEGELCNMEQPLRVKDSQGRVNEFVLKMEITFLAAGLRTTGRRRIGDMGHYFATNSITQTRYNDTEVTRAAPTGRGTVLLYEKVQLEAAAAGAPRPAELNVAATSGYRAHHDHVDLADAMATVSISQAAEGVAGNVANAQATGAHWDGGTAAQTGHAAGDGAPEAVDDTPELERLSHSTFEGHGNPPACGFRQCVCSRPPLICRWSAQHTSSRGAGERPT